MAFTTVFAYSPLSLSALCMDHATSSLALDGKKKKLRLEEHAAWHTLLKKKEKRKKKKKKKKIKQAL